MFGGDSEEVTPVPIPNTAVKLFSADGSWGFPPVRVGRRQAISKDPPFGWSFFVFIRSRKKMAVFAYRLLLEHIIKDCFKRSCRYLISHHIECDDL